MRPPPSAGGHQGVDGLDLIGADPARRVVDEPWRKVMRFEIARNRQLYAHADQGLAHLPGASRRCVATARQLYAQILDLVEANDYDVFSGRLRLPTWRKAMTAARGGAGGVGRP